MWCNFDSCKFTINSLTTETVTIGKIVRIKVKTSIQSSSYVLNHAGFLIIFFYSFNHWIFLKNDKIIETKDSIWCIF